jgi:sedoheptulose-bisphosphatase
VSLDDGTYEFTYGCTPEGCQLPDGSWEPWICSRQQIKIAEDCRIFAPANLRAAQEVPGYHDLIDHCKFNMMYAFSYGAVQVECIHGWLINFRFWNLVQTCYDITTVMGEKYTLRYSGGLVPDIYQQFTKEQGVFTNPTSKSSPAKLRLAFEAAPFGLLVEKSGGKTSDGVTGGSILDVQIDGVDQRTALAIGSANEVDRFNNSLGLGK